MSDQQAAGVVRAARAAGCDIPGELALTGWDDVPTATELSLTTVASPCVTKAWPARTPRWAKTQETSPRPGR